MSEATDPRAEQSTRHGVANGVIHMFAAATVIALAGIAVAISYSHMRLLLLDAAAGEEVTADSGCRGFLCNGRGAVLAEPCRVPLRRLRVRPGTRHAIESVRWLTRRNVAARTAPISASTCSLRMRRHEGRLRDPLRR